MTLDAFESSAARDEEVIRDRAAHKDVVSERLTSAISAKLSTFLDELELDDQNTYDLFKGAPHKRLIGEKSDATKTKEAKEKEEKEKEATAKKRNSGGADAEIDDDEVEVVGGGGKKTGRVSGSGKTAGKGAAAAAAAAAAPPPPPPDKNPSAAALAAAKAAAAATAAATATTAAMSKITDALALMANKDKDKDKDKTRKASRPNSPDMPFYDDLVVGGQAVVSEAEASARVAAAVAEEKARSAGQLRDIESNSLQAQLHLMRATIASNDNNAERDKDRSARREADAMQLSAYNVKMQAMASAITHAASTGNAEMLQQVASLACGEGGAVQLSGQGSYLSIQAQQQQQQQHQYQYQYQYQ